MFSGTAFALNSNCLSKVFGCNGNTSAAWSLPSAKLYSILLPLPFANFALNLFSIWSFSASVALPFKKLTIVPPTNPFLTLFRWNCAISISSSIASKALI